MDCLVDLGYVGCVMRKTSIYMRKRRTQINQDGYLVKKHPMAVLRECRPFNGESGTDANARDALGIVFAAFDRMCNGVSTETNDFDYLSHALGVAEIRAVEIAGTESNPLLELIAPANAVMQRCKARYLKWGKFELYSHDVTQLRDALDVYETILIDSSPRQMADATKTRMVVLKEMGFTA